MRSKLRSAVVTTALLTFVTATGLASSTHAPAVLRVGSYKGIAGQYSTVQAAVLAAAPGDWVLVGPGDYKEEGFKGMDEASGVLIEKPYLHLRGMNRNTVIIDGTKAGTPVCSGRKQDQTFTKDGMNGVVAFKVDGVSIENLTACNYLTGTSGGEGNEIWWNGGDGSGKIGMGRYWGDYITATSTYSNGFANPRGEYGIFVSNAKGPGIIDHSYASNMGDAAYYIGACPDCNAILRRAHGQFSALGFSGTNAGGHLIIERNEFDHNAIGAAPDSQNNDDAPSPNSGRCPNPNEISAAGTNSCSIWRYNFFHDNNNPNVPGLGTGGLAGSAPVGTGIALAGIEYHTLYKNRFENNGSWGVLVTDLPDQEDPPKDVPSQNCNGGISVLPTGAPAIGPLYSGGFSGNTDPAGLTAYPPAALLQSDLYACNRPNGGDVTLTLLQANCATRGLLFPCPDTPLTHYPPSTLVMLRMSPRQPTMPDPCKGVPANPWCPRNGSTAYGVTGTVATVAGAAWIVLGAALVRRRPLDRRH